MESNGSINEIARGETTSRKVVSKNCPKLAAELATLSKGRSISKLRCLESLACS